MRENARAGGKAARGGAKESSPFFPCISPASSFALRVTSHDIPQVDSLFAGNKFCVHMHLNKTKS